jgi:hypothetical protein
MYPPIPYPQGIVPGNLPIAQGSIISCSCDDENTPLDSLELAKGENTSEELLVDLANHSNDPFLCYQEVEVSDVSSCCTSPGVSKLKDASAPTCPPNSSSITGSRLEPSERPTVSDRVVV